MATEGTVQQEVLCSNHFEGSKHFSSPNSPKDMINLPIITIFRAQKVENRDFLTLQMT